MIDVALDHANLWVTYRHKPSHQVLLRGTTADGSIVTWWEEYEVAFAIDRDAHYAPRGKVTVQIDPERIKTGADL